MCLREPGGSKQTDLPVWQRRLTSIDLFSSLAVCRVERLQLDKMLLWGFKEEQLAWTSKQTNIDRPSGYPTFTGSI